MTDTGKTRYVRTVRTADDYQELSDREHVYQIPDTYIGSTDPEERTEVLLDYQASPMKLIHSKISVSRGIERLFLEIISNAGDNTDASRRFGINPGSIDVTMDKKCIRIRNGGAPIPVKPHPMYEDKYVPDIIFGKLRSSSNYDTSVIRMGCGRNGFGAKLTNIFSHNFTVKIGDPENKLQYTGNWQENMKIGPESVVESYKGKEGFVEISWYLDFKRFGIDEYPEEAFFLFARYVADFSLTCKIPVSFNGVAMNFSNIKDYARLYWGSDECDSSIYHCEWPGFSKTNLNGIPPDGIKPQNQLQKISAAVKAEHIPIVEMMVIDTPDEGVCLSFVNGLLTIDGGVHTSEAYSSISSHVIEIVNTAMNNNTKKKGKAKDDVPIPKLNADDVRRHISIIINCRLPDPKYSSQSKTKLSSPRPHIYMTVDELKVVEKWGLIARLYAALEAKMFNILKKSNGGRVKHLMLENGQDANEAGRDKSSQCILYLVEGKSASGYPKKRIVMTDGGKDLGGWFPLRGKFLNARNAHILRIAANKEVKAIKEMLGLVEDVDYSLPENLLTLRYGYVLICTDADSDGSHIASLLINYFDQFFPGLLKTGRIGLLRTPVVRIANKSGEILKRFFTTAEYDKWEKENVIDGVMPKGMEKPVYYKGLGKSDDFEIRDDLTSAPVVTVIYDEHASGSLKIAFDKDMASVRKEWISKWRDATHVQDIHVEDANIYKKQNITDYINHELIEYTKDVLFRAIPSMDDGLKRSHRQALYAALTHFKYGRKNELMGVSRFANYAANLTNYHHGETSMCDTVIKMGQTFTGSNNLPFFNGKGEFGTRSGLGDDAASPRYLSVNLPKYAHLLYDEEAIECIPKRVIEGDEVEPVYLPAVIPMHLVNGSIGIATGYSTFIPNHNYFDVINWLKEKCNGASSPNNGNILKPWYKGFKGEISFVNADREDVGENGDPIVRKLDDDEEEDELEKEARNLKTALQPRGLSIRTRGIFKIGQTKDKADLIITEIPIATPIEQYRKWLELQVKEKKIYDFRDNSTTEEPLFTVKGYAVSDRTTVTYKMIHLDRYFPLTNITMINEHGYPTKFENTTQVLEVYYAKMIPLYEKVKNARLQSIRSKVEDLTHRIRFISAVLENKIIVFKRKKADILKDMAAHDPAIPEKYLTLVKLHEMTQEEITEAYDEIRKLTELFNTTQKATAEKLWLDKLEALESYLKKNM
jgi:DNA topoisomerase-2